MLVFVKIYCSKKYSISSKVWPTQPTPNQKTKQNQQEKQFN